MADISFAPNSHPEFEPPFTRYAREEAEKLGLKGRGRNDAVDAFRHTYIIALITYYAGNSVASVAGEINEIKGDFLNNQPPTERRMDEFNNAVGREIGKKAKSREEIGQLVYRALINGELIIDDADTAASSPFENDPNYVQPLGIPDPNADNPLKQRSEHFQPLSARIAVPDEISGSGDAATDSGGFFSSIGSSVGSMFSALGSGASSLFGGIGDFFGSLASRFTGGDDEYDPRKGVPALSTRFTKIGLDPGVLEKLLREGTDNFAQRLAANISKSESVGGLALGRTLAQNSGMFSDLIRASQKDQLGATFQDAMFGKNGSGGMMGDLMGNFMTQGFNRLINGGVKTRTTSYESERSRAWKPSRGQQAAELARMIARGQRNI